MAWEPDRRSNFFSPPAHLCAVTYDWNIVNCDVKQPIQLNLYWPFSAQRFTDMLYKFWQIIILNDFTENLFNATFMIDIIVT